MSSTEAMRLLLQKAKFLVAKFQQGGDTAHIDEAVIVDRKALDLCSSSGLERSIIMSHLALHLYYRYTRIGSIDDLNEAILLDRDVLALHPPGTEDRAQYLEMLAVHLSARYEHSCEISDLKEAIVFKRDALALQFPDNPGRWTILSNLASKLCDLFNLHGEIYYINEAIALARDVLAGDGRQLTSLSDLSVYLAARYTRLGKIDDLNEAILLVREALAVCPPNHRHRSDYLHALSSHLHLQFNQSGKTEDLRQAIVLAREALALRPPGHPSRPKTLNNLALHLSVRYNQLRVADDLDEAICLSRESLVIRPPGDSNRDTPLNNLALHLLTRYKQKGEIGDLDEGIALAQESLALHPPGNPERSASLNNLAVLFSSKYDRLKRTEDLDEAIALAREVLELHPPGHTHRLTSLNNLASHLFTRSKALWKIDDLDEATVLEREALALHPRDHPQWSNILKNLADCLVLRFQLLAGEEVPEELFSLYAQMENVSGLVSSYDLTAAKTWIEKAEFFRHSTTLAAHKTALRLLVQHVNSLPPLPQHLPLFKDISASLAADAFSACIRNHAFTDAVELLEQSRGIFWSLLSRLRSPLDDVVAHGPAGKELADQFTRLTSLIRTVLDSPGADQHDQVWRLNLELQRVVSDIRGLSGLSRFLLPPSFSDLKRAASDGPVIIVNASQYGCDALVVFVDRDPAHIQLEITRDEVQKLASKLRELTKLSKSTDMTRDLGVFLRELWDKVVSHIVDFLQTACPLQSRIWWCPTGEFSLLPLHAAGAYRKGQQNLSFLYTSSYTPTLTALIRARRPSSPHSEIQKKHFIAIGQAEASDGNELLSVSTELAKIGQLIGDLAIFTCIEGSDSRISRVADELGKNDWVHFACHGFPNRKEPFKSAFALLDGRFTIQNIIRSTLRNPEFAYLSACHTTAEDEDRPDEMIHLASAMHFAGFRSVIGTMWSVDDAETAKITSVFYKLMVDESGHLDHSRAAYALRKTMRSVNIALDQRILYIHIGA